MSKHEYNDDEASFEGYLSFKNLETKRPCVLVAHAWDGPNNHFNSIADDLAQKGFVAFAIDVYGKGKRGKIDGDNSHLMNPLLENRALLRKRLLTAFTEAQRLSMVIPDQIAILGYCFGGLCAIDLARANPIGLKGAISIHGLLTPPNLAPPSKINSSLLILHGWEDPLVPPNSVLSFTEEMTKAQADWQIHCYGHAKHAFTFIGADLPQLGIKYNEKAHQRSERATNDFLNEIFDEHHA